MSSSPTSNDIFDGHQADDDDDDDDQEGDDDDDDRHDNDADYVCWFSYDCHMVINW